jgi:FkbM family methyltransferase
MVNFGNKPRIIGKGFIKRIILLKRRGFPLHYVIPSLLTYEALCKSLCSCRYLILPNGFRVILPTIRYQNIRRGTLYTYSEIFIYNEYSRLPEYNVHNGDIVLDVGAFVGLYTLSVADKASFIIAIEPNIASYTFLINNIKLNKLHSKVMTFNVALGDFEGRTMLYIEDWLAGSSTLFNSWHKDYGHSLSIPVRVTTLDNLLKSLGIDRIDMAKIDVEGAELMVLRGAMESLRMHLIRKLIIEVHLGIVDIRDVKGFLEKHNYKVDLLEVRGDTALLYGKVKD